MGPDCQISDHVKITGPQYVSIGKGVSLNEYVIIQSCGGAEIVIGDNVCFSYGAYALTGGLALADRGNHVVAPIHIGDSVWVGARAIILPGTKIGAGTVIAAGAVVTRDVRAGATVAGVPAREIH